MSDFNNGYARPLPQTADMSVDAGLRSFMLGVYNKLALGLVVAGALAYVTGNVPAVQQLLEKTGTKPEEVELLICATTTLRAIYVNAQGANWPA